MKLKIIFDIKLSKLLLQVKAKSNLHLISTKHTTVLKPVIKMEKLLVHFRYNLVYLCDYFASPDCQVSLYTQLHEPLEGRRVDVSSHDHQHLSGQLYVWLPTKIPTRRTLKHETKIWKLIN